jgi:hypothetical protein
MTFRVPMCVYCRHFRAAEAGNTCAAFPDGDGIPDAIFYDDVPHFASFPGDHGIHFEPVDERSAMIVERRFGHHRTVVGAIDR